MTDEINKKVIDLFSAGKTGKKVKHCNDGKVCETREGYFYISIDSDDNGRPLDKEKLLQIASEYYYIVKVLDENKGKTCINNFKVPANDLLDFIKMHTVGEKQGQIIEIDKFFSEEWA